MGIENAEQRAAELPRANFFNIDLAFYFRRLSIPLAIIAMSTLFPDVNMILSLLGGSICGVCFIVMPVFFYRQAYLVRPSKKNRCCQIWLGNLIVAIALPIGFLGVALNVQKMMHPTAAEHPLSVE